PALTLSVLTSTPLVPTVVEWLQSTLLTASKRLSSLSISSGSTLQPYVEVHGTLLTTDLQRHSTSQTVRLSNSCLTTKTWISSPVHHATGHILMRNLLSPSSSSAWP